MFAGSNDSIPRRMFVATALAVGLALLVAAAALFLWDRYVFRAYATEDLSTTAKVLGDSLQAALTFGDEQAANETLGYLVTTPHIVSGCAYDAEGRLLASYSAANASAECPASPPSPLAAREGSRIVVSEDVIRSGKRFGTLYLTRATDDIERRLLQRLGLLAAIAVISLGLSLVFSNRTRQSISAPIVSLAETAKRVSDLGDYALRAAKTSGGEIGVLVDSFNEMLARIEAQTADLEEASRLKDEFVAKLSHELRTPLNAVLGWTSMIRDGAVSKQKMDTGLEVIERNAKSQLRIIEDLLDISRIATGKLKIDQHPVDLSEVAQRAVEVVQLAADAKQIRLHRTDQGHGLMVLGDAGRLQQMTWNLLANSIKFTPVGGVVSADVRRVRDFVELVVSDSGEGMAPEFVPYAFDPFRQARDSSSGGTGLGLGLALVKQIAELHGGKARIESSSPSTGTTMIVSLPAFIVRPLRNSDQPFHASSRFTRR
jgi:signal transduction histidine kinase